MAVASLQNNRRLVITVEGNQPHCDFVTESGTVAIGTDKGLFVHQFDDSLPMQVITRNATFGIERLPDAILTLERQEFPESNNINQLNAHRDHPTRLVYREAPSLNATKSVAVLRDAKFTPHQSRQKHCTYQHDPMARSNLATRRQSQVFQRRPSACSNSRSTILARFRKSPSSRQTPPNSPIT